MPTADADEEAQEYLRAAARDLERLQTLLADAGATLLARFAGASACLRDATQPQPEAALRQLDAAVTALQFQDMAQQLIAHTQQRLARCTLPRAGGADAAITNRRANPVTQAGIRAGSIDLF